MLEAAE